MSDDIEVPMKYKSFHIQHIFNKNNKSYLLLRKIIFCNSDKIWHFLIYIKTNKQDGENKITTTSFN